MFVENLITSETREILQSTDYLERKRLYTLLKNAIDYPLIIVCAGSGYGKTHAVYSFLKQFSAHAHITWLQISERDNIAARFWESYSNQVSVHMPKIGARLKQIGFPKADEAFSNYSAIRRELSMLPGKHIRVFDDFHLIHDESVLRFFERGVNLLTANLTMILISRTMPEINMIGMMMRGNVFTIQEDELRFTEDEMTKYFSQYKLPVTREDIRNIYNDTQGWAIAINLVARSLSKKQKYERYAFDAMKKNIFRFIEDEISQTVSAPLLNFLLRISLIDHLASGLIKTIALSVSADAGALIKEMELLNAYIRYDFIMDTYMIHHLFLDYLRQKQDQILTDKERKETYQSAGIWCDANGYHMDALSYYEKSADYDAIINKIASLNLEIPIDMAQYALDILDNLQKSGEKIKNPLFSSMHIKLNINLGKFDEACTIAQKYAAQYESLPETPQRNQTLCAIYASWGAARLYMCTYTDVYDFDVYYKKMSEYFDKNPFNLIGSYKLTSTAWSSIVGTNRPGAMEEYIASVSRVTPYLSHVMNGFYSGFEELVRGELCFYQRKFNDAEQFLKQSIAKARKYDQYVTQNRALVYLMFINFSNGDITGATARLKEMESLLSEKDHGVHYTIYDISRGFYHLALEQNEQIPEWLKGDFSPYTHSSFLENYANRIKARYHYQTRQYDALLTFIESALKHPAILLGKIELLTLKALVLYQQKKRSEAICAFTQAYLLSESNNIKASFTEFAKDMRTLTLAVQKSSSADGSLCPAPKKWLQEVNRISSIYAKRKAKMISEYYLANNPEERIMLTDKEIAVLKDLAGGLSRTEIAFNRNISVNDAKMTVNIIFKKLGVLNLPEAIRAAVIQKII